MNWQVTYAIKNISENYKGVLAQHIHGEAIKVTMPDKPDVIAVVSAAYRVNVELAMQCYADYPDMDFLCGYRKECVWEGEAIKFLENKAIGWGSAGTLNSSVYSGEVRGAAHKDYSFSYRLIRQIRSIIKLDRELDRIFTMTLTGGRIVRVGMIMEYEPTADAVRSFWDEFGPIDVVWNINPNGSPTQQAIEAGNDLGCKVMKWSELKALIRHPL